MGVAVLITRQGHTYRYEYNTPQEQDAVKKKFYEQANREGGIRSSYWGSGQSLSPSETPAWEKEREVSRTETISYGVPPPSVPTETQMTRTERLRIAREQAIKGVSGEATKSFLQKATPEEKQEFILGSGLANVQSGSKGTTLYRYGVLEGQPKEEEKILMKRKETQQGRIIKEEVGGVNEKLPPPYKKPSPPKLWDFSLTRAKRVGEQAPQEFAYIKTKSREIAETPEFGSKLGKTTRVISPVFFYGVSKAAEIGEEATKKPYITGAVLTGGYFAPAIATAAGVGFTGYETWKGFEKLKEGETSAPQFIGEEIATAGLFVGVPAKVSARAKFFGEVGNLSLPKQKAFTSRYLRTRKIEIFEKGLRPKNLKLTGLERLPKKAIKPSKQFLQRRFFGFRENVLGGSLSFRSYGIERGKGGFKESDLDIYTIRNPVKQAQRLAREYKAAGIKRVSTVKGKVTIMGKKVAEFHPLTNLKQNIMYVEPIFRPTFTAIGSTEEGIRVLKPLPQARRKLVGFYFDKRTKDLPDYKLIVGSFGKEKQPTESIINIKEPQIKMGRGGEGRETSLMDYSYKPYSKYPKTTRVYGTYSKENYRERPYNQIRETPYKVTPYKTPKTIPDITTPYKQPTQKTPIFTPYTPPKTSKLPIPEPPYKPTSTLKPRTFKFGYPERKEKQQGLGIKMPSLKLPKRSYSYRPSLVGIGLPKAKGKAPKSTFKFSGLEIRRLFK